MAFNSSSVCGVVYEGNLCQTCPFTEAQVAEQVALAAEGGARRWSTTLDVVSASLLGTELLLLALAVALRRRRPMQHVGTSFVVLILLGCAAGNASTWIDSFRVTPFLCRLRLALFYLFMTLLLAARLGKLVSHCARVRMYNAAGPSGARAMGWDVRARKSAAALVAAQLVALGSYLAVAADDPAEECCVYSVCSLGVGELAFNGCESRYAPLP